MSCWKASRISKRRCSSSARIAAKRIPSPPEGEGRGEGSKIVTALISRSLPVAAQPGAHGGDSFRHVAPPEADPEPVLRYRRQCRLIDAGRQQHHANLLGKARAETLDPVLAL